MIRNDDLSKVFGILLISILFWGCAATSEKHDSPSWPLVVEGNVYEFEYAGPSQTVSHEFKFANEGDAPLVLKGLSVCCGCEAAMLGGPEEPVSPGGSVTVLVSCTMPRYEGGVEKVITVDTDVPGCESVPLTMKGQVKRDIVVTPSALFFGDLKKGQASARKLRVLQMSDEELEIVKVEADPNRFKVDTVRLDEPNHKGFVVTVVFSAEVPGGAFSDAITIHTNDRRRARIDVPIIAQIKD